MACFVSTRQQALHLLRIDPATGSAPALYRPGYQLGRRLPCIDPAAGSAPVLYDCIDPATGPAPAPYGLLRIDPAIGPAPAPYRPGYRLGRPLLRIDPAAGSAPALYRPGYRPDTCSIWPASYRPGNRPGACFVSTRLPARRLLCIDPATGSAPASIRLPTRRLLCIDPATGPAPALYLPCYRDRSDTCSVIIIESVWPAPYRPGNRPGTCSVSTRLPAGSGPAPAPYSDPCI